MTVAELAEKLGLRPRTIRIRCSERRMYPAPISYQRPYLFSAAKVMRVLDGTEEAPKIYPRPNRRTARAPRRQETQ